MLKEPEDKREGSTRKQQADEEKKVPKKWKENTGEWETQKDKVEGI